ncbi:hypothetical protein OF83DRAFT_1179297 [Amylostereum chailletii]|nr:hypothetical protein OF83DRAFT_1179297 [Amylostereum chailletii]
MPSPPKVWCPCCQKLISRATELRHRRLAIQPILPEDTHAIVQAVGQSSSKHPLLETPPISESTTRDGTGQVKRRRITGDVDTQGDEGNSKKSATTLQDMPDIDIEPSTPPTPPHNEATNLADQDQVSDIWPATPSDINRGNMDPLRATSPRPLRSRQAMADGGTSDEDSDLDLEVDTDVEADSDVDVDGSFGDIAPDDPFLDVFDTFGEEFLRETQLDGTSLPLILLILPSEYHGSRRS